MPDKALIDVLVGLSAIVFLLGFFPMFFVDGRPCIVYNVFEDSYAEVNEDGLVVTGVAGEMWPIGESALRKYNVSLDQLSYEPVEVYTIETGDVFCGIQNLLLKQTMV